MAGTSDLVQKSNNHFGIKCKDTWKGESVFHDDDLRGECFRKYSTAADSYRDHSDFLKGSPRYASLFDLDPTDYRHWAYGLKKAGYATNPQYPQIIIKLIEDYHLEDYTLIGMGQTIAKEVEIAKADPQPSKVMPPVSSQVITVARKEDPVPQVIPEEKKPVIEKPQKEETRITVSKPSYPEGEFKLNETRVVYARKGSSYLGLAEQYNVPLARIFEFNDMGAAETVDNDRIIFLQRKRKTGNNEFHIVQPGESLYDIAQVEAIRLETLLEYNWLKPGMKPAIGDKLFLRQKADAMPSLDLPENYTLYKKPVAAPSFIQHTVKPKETIYSVARAYDVRVDDIVRWNDLRVLQLKTGQSLKIYK